MPSQKLDWNAIIIQAMKTAEKSPIFAHFLAQLPSFVVMMMTGGVGNTELVWDVTKGLISTNNNLYNIAWYNYAQQNEIADAEAQSMKGYAELIKAVGEFPRSIVGLWPTDRKKTK